MKKHKFKIKNKNGKIIFLLFQFLFVIFIFSFCIFNYHDVSFASDNISVSPSIIQLDLKTDQPEADLTYTNNANSVVELSLSASDFTELEDGYKISFLQGKDAQNYHYSLSSWIKFETNDITLNSNESKKIKIFIDANNLTTGGHYATILAQWIQRGNEGNVHMRAILSSLLFVRTAHGNEREEASIDLFTPIENFFLFPSEFAVKFRNSGNVELTPHGLLEVKDMFGNLVARGLVNDGSLITLPETIRRYTALLRDKQSFMLPGFYKANLWIHYGQADKQIHDSMTFFSQGNLPYIPIALLIIVIILIILLRKRRQR